MRLFVVGGTGGLGRLVAAEAAGRGHQVTALARDPARAGLPGVVMPWRGAGASGAGSGTWLRWVAG